jgi:hypothetical protein
MKNSIFLDPKDWASKAVGSSFRYRLMQLVTLLLGVLLAVMLYFICREARLPLLGYFGVLVFLVIAVVELPLCYLRALRSYVAEHQSSHHEIS